MRTLNKIRLLNLSIILSILASINMQAQLKSPNNQADYLIITPTQFVSTLQPFVNWRQQKNLNVKVAELQQIYSEFPDSTQPSSIRDFISYALTYWITPKVKYVLLVGGAKLLPSYRVQSAFASDSSLNEDSVSIDEWYSINKYETNTKPDVELGRFPVYNAQELSNIISKTIYFEDSLTIEDYPKDFTFLADKSDSTTFEHAASRFINSDLPSIYTTNIIFSGEDSTVDLTRAHLFNSLNNGTLFLSYYGHGAPDKWSKYNFFTYGDIDSLKVNNLPFIYTSAACSQSFDPPNDSSIVRKLITLDRIGTVASVNATGLNFLSSGEDFLTNFYNYLFTQKDITIGDAVLQTKLYIENYDYSAYQLTQRYTLLGDPALRIPVKTISQVFEATDKIPWTYSLKQNYPNPFNPSTTISYSIAKQTLVTIKVYDIIGREISTLVNEEKNSGSYAIKFDGSKLTSGIYFYQIKAGNYVSSKKMLLLK